MQRWIYCLLAILLMSAVSTEAQDTLSATGRELLTMKGHIRSVTSVTFSPDGKRLASASQDQTVKVWDAANGQETLTLKGHTGEIYSVAFSHDGKRLASTGRDRTVKVWDVTSMDGSQK